jgi:hypothetical protein
MECARDRTPPLFGRQTPTPYVAGEGICNLEPEQVRRYAVGFPGADGCDPVERSLALPEGGTHDG